MTTATYLAETVSIIDAIDHSSIDAVAAGIASTSGRIFVLGVGGSAATASHMVNDLRKISRREAYAPTDNVAELTARANDDGWEFTFSAWLTWLRPDDAILVLSVGGGSWSASPNIVRALRHAQDIGTPVYGIVGRDGGWTAAIANACVVIPPLFPNRVTPHTEGLASVICHLLVSHPELCP
jgi:D-sedoheptulose 7-phosphate isomerase